MQTVLQFLVWISTLSTGQEAADRFEKEHQSNNSFAFRTTL